MRKSQSRNFQKLQQFQITTQFRFLGRATISQHIFKNFYNSDIGYPSSMNWVDARDQSPLVWDGDFSDVGGNKGITDYAGNNHSHGFMGKFQLTFLY